MQKRALDQTRDAAVTEMARALADPDTGPGIHCLSRTLVIEHAQGSVGPLMDLRAPSEARSPGMDDRLQPGAVIFMPERGNAELITKRGKLVWLAEDLTEEQQDTVNAYARGRSPGTHGGPLPQGQGRPYAGEGMAHIVPRPGSRGRQAQSRLLVPGRPGARPPRRLRLRRHPAEYAGRGQDETGAGKTAVDKRPGATRNNPGQSATDPGRRAGEKPE